jgi:enamine deaminase RidA (YjgF/YER057c/UK114 family)
VIKRIQAGKRMSQAVVCNGVAYIAGQVADNRLGSPQDQTREVLAKIERLLAEAGTAKSNLLAVDIYLPQIADFNAMNEVYDAWIDPANPPARACVEARLADPNLRIEVSAIAAVG